MESILKIMEESILLQTFFAAFDFNEEVDQWLVGWQ